MACQKEEIVKETKDARVGKDDCFKEEGVIRGKTNVEDAKIKTIHLSCSGSPQGLESRPPDNTPDWLANQRQHTCLNVQCFGEGFLCRYKKIMFGWRKSGGEK